nr:MAG TPA: hypothetical protein [Caudoviricetes sp.]
MIAIIFIIGILLVISYKPHFEIINGKSLILWYTNLKKERKWILIL